MLNDDDRFQFRDEPPTDSQVLAILQELDRERARSAELLKALKQIKGYKKDLGGGRLGPTDAAVIATYAIADFEHYHEVECD